MNAHNHVATNDAPWLTAALNYARRRLISSPRIAGPAPTAATIWSRIELKILLDIRSNL
jgi:hypothetical protein